MAELGTVVALINSMSSSLKEAIMTIPKGVEWKFSGSDLLLGFGFSDALDYVIVMNRGRANNLFDFAKLGTKTRGASLADIETADLTTVWSSGTDMHAPFQVIATSNADGYHQTTTDTGFVGGNHTLDQMGAGFETASSVYVHFYADGVPVSSGNGFAQNFEIKWKNDIQGYNTCKQGGGGRAVLSEYHDMIFDGEIFRERIMLKALEEIKLSLWYGLQCVSIGTTYTKIAFVDGSNRGTFSSSDNSIISGNATTSGFIAYGDPHRIEMNVDTNIDLGKRTLYSGTSGAFVSSTKGYFGIINQNTTVSAGAMYYLDGSYRFLPQIYETKDCTGISLDYNSLSFESVGETKTLTATLTPSDTTDSLTWASSDTNVATVNSSGVVTIHGIGSATITATCGIQSASATISVSTLKAQYPLKMVSDTAPDGYSPAGLTDSLIGIQSVSGQKTVGQEYHNDDDVRLLNGDTYDVEAIKIPYGATKCYIHTTDGTSVSISYWFLLDTVNKITNLGITYPKEISKNTFFNTNSGATVEYGQAILFRPLDAQAEKLSYVYFE